MDGNQYIVSVSIIWSHLELGKVTFLLLINHFMFFFSLNVEPNEARNKLQEVKYVIVISLLIILFIHQSIHTIFCPSFSYLMIFLKNWHQMYMTK